MAAMQAYRALMRLNTELIEKRRVEMRYQKTALAKIMGVTPMGYWYIMKKRSTSFDRIELLAKALELPESRMIVFNRRETKKSSK
jgi:hypothetical protein